MKKILISLTVIAAAAAIVVGATGAFFSDTETSTDNVFTAGSIDLEVDSEAHFNGMVCVEEPTGTFTWQPELGTTVNSSHYPQPGTPCDGTWEETDLEDGVHTFFNFTDLKPGDEGENTISLHVYDNDAWGWFTLRKLTDYDNTCTEPELEAELNCDPNGEGELDEAVALSIWLDQGQTPGFQNGGQGLDDEGEGDNILNYNEPLLEYGYVHEFDPFDLSQLLSQAYGVYASQVGTCPDANSDGHNNYGPCHGLAEDGRMVGSTTYYFAVKWELPFETGNEVQTDSFGGDMEFVVVQHRNNPNKDGGPALNSTRYTGNALVYSSTGWAGHSCPADTQVVGGGIVGGATHPITEGMAKAGVTVSGSTYPNYPHYNYTSPEEGWVVQNGGTPQTMTIYVDCI